MPIDFPAASLAWFQDLLQASSGLGDFVYYSLIYDYLQDEIRKIGPEIMQRSMGTLSAFALAMTTVWVAVEGHRVMRGKSRHSMAEFVALAARNTFVIFTATTMMMLGQDLQTFVSDGMNRMAVEIVTGEDKTASQMIEENLALTQLAMSSIEMVEVSEDGSLSLSEEKTRALWMAGFGAAGPAVTGGGLLLMYEIAMALFIGLGPLFILCLVSDATRQLFWKWLYYGLGSLFSMAVLALMTGLALKIVAAVSLSFWASAGIGAATGQNLTAGMSGMALQQGGIGLLLTMLLISAPPIAGNFFQGALAQFNPYSVFGHGRVAAAPGAHGGRSMSSAAPANTRSAYGASAQPPLGAAAQAGGYTTTGSALPPGSRGVSTIQG